MLDESAHRSQRPREFWAKCTDMETCLVHYLDSFFLGHTKTILHNGRNLLYYIVTFKQQTTMKNLFLLFAFISLSAVAQTVNPELLTKNWRAFWVYVPNTDP